MDAAPATAYFTKFHFEIHSARLWKGDDEVPLRPKTAEVLRCLVTRPGEVVSKGELIEVVWPEGFVGDNALSVCIHELRELLGDDAQQPVYIATEHRRGYRFLAPVSSAPIEPMERLTRQLVGRDNELATIGEWWSKALNGRRQTGFIAAQAGVGKTYLTEAFVSELSPESNARFAWGQCVELYGGGEPYLPVLDALTGLCHGPDGQRIWTVLQSQAPTWAVQIPGLGNPSDAERMQSQTVGATSDRRLRELAQALETLTARSPLLLVLEDLHDADSATVGLLSYLARRRQPASLLVLGTYRPAEAVARAHPLRQVVQDLRTRGLCEFLALELLSRGAVVDYLTQRLAPNRASEELITDIYRRTDGNALFLVNIVDYLVGHEYLVDQSGVVSSRSPLGGLGLPESLRQLIDLQIEQVGDDDRELVEVASAIGVEFTTDTMAAALGNTVHLAEVEDRCRRLSVETGLIFPDGHAQWPEGPVATRYRFAHALHQEVLYEHHLGPARKRAAHLHIGEHLVRVHGERSRDVASELAVHFERGGDTANAVRYLGLAAETALERSAHATALRHTSRALDMVPTSTSPTSQRLEIDIRLVEARAMMVAGGRHATRVEETYLRAEELAETINDEHARVTSLCGRWNWAMTQGDLTLAAGIAGDLLDLAKDTAEPSYRLQAHNLAGETAMFAGDLRAAASEVDAAGGLYDPDSDRQLTLTYGDDPEVVRHLYGSFVYWLLGEANRGRQLSARGLELARSMGYPAGVAHALWHAAVVHQLSGHHDLVLELTDELVHLADKYDLQVWAPLGNVLNGWAKARSGQPDSALSQIREGLRRWTNQGFRLTFPYHTGLLSDALTTLDKTTEALEMAEAALSASRASGERWYEAEAARMRAELRYREGMSDLDEFEADLVGSIAVARRQGARAFELRATISLARSWSERGEVPAARLLLDEVIEGLEGHDTVDLEAANELRSELPGGQPVA